MEWRGGILSLVIDEAVLNTREYAGARAYIRRYFFVKAIVSLPRDAFEDLARTTAKTSILFMVKKEEAGVLQREPIFFAYAMRTGPSGSDLLKPNDLDALCNAYDVWRTHVLAACRTDGTPVPTLLRIQEARSAAKLEINPLVDQADFDVWDLASSVQEERLDVAYWRSKTTIAALPATVPLSDLAELVTTGRVPAHSDFYSFAFVSRLTAMVDSRGPTDTQYGVEELQTLVGGDVLVSGIDLVHGSIGVVEEDCAGKVVSKEYYILRVRNGVDAHWLVAMLRTPLVKRIIEGTVTGTSNRTRVESAEALMGLRVPPAPESEVQAAVGQALRDAHCYHRKAQAGVKEAEQLAVPKV